MSLVPVIYPTRFSTQERDGWYQTMHLEGIKAVLRHKFFSLLEGRVATDKECTELLSNLSESRRYTTYTRKSRKHNKAKGALPPEEAAVRAHTILLHAKLKRFSRLSAFERLWRKKERRSVIQSRILLTDNINESHYLTCALLDRILHEDEHNMIISQL